MSIKKILFSVCLSCLVIISYSQNNDAAINIDPPVQTERVKDLNPSPGFVKHKVAKGEWLEKIAAKYKTKPKKIYKDNPKMLKQKYLRPGQIIVVRPGRKYFA